MAHEYGELRILVDAQWAVGRNAGRQRRRSEGLRSRRRRRSSLSDRRPSSPKRRADRARSREQGDCSRDRACRGNGQAARLGRSEKDGPAKLHRNRPPRAQWRALATMPRTGDGTLVFNQTTSMLRECAAPPAKGRKCYPYVRYTSSPMSRVAHRVRQPGHPWTRNRRSPRACHATLSSEIPEIAWIRLSSVTSSAVKVRMMRPLYMPTIRSLT